MPDLVSPIREHYLRILDEIAVAARTAGRAPESIQLVVVTKAQPLEVVQAVIEAGARVLGENYPEEALQKIQAVGAQPGLEWHMIGHVQSRKADLILANFALLHSLDSLKLAARLDRFAAEGGRKLPVLLEFNVGGEQSKYGWPAEDESRWPELLVEIDTVLKLKHLSLRGMMTMPPLGEDAEFSRPFFRRLHRLQEFLAKRFPQAEWRELSMGTSADYEVAVQEGATLVRVGQAIVGPRPHYGG